ncbi:MAG: hypothetical protein ACAH83_13525 [Alphaproteobacteria bacterium]
MPFFNKEERAQVKRFLSDVMTDKDVKQQFNSAQKRQKEIQSDYTDAMLRQYMGILQEISDERANFVPPKPDVQGPSLKELKKKFLGPKK